MALYYLHVCNGTGFVEDEEGHELAGDDEARSAAIRSARDLMASEIRDGILNLASFIEVEDESHTLLFTVGFAEALQINTQRTC
jgi:hypothetical protein